jgi:hypothetical protein
MPPKNVEKEKKPRCPNGQVRDKKTGECVPKVVKENPVVKEKNTKKTVDAFIKIQATRKACIQKMRKKIQTKKQKK